MIYHPLFTETELEEKFSKLRKLKYNQFRWWRMYDNPNPPKHKNFPLLDKIKNGDFDYSHYGYQAMWCEHEINKMYKEMGHKDMGRFVAETSLLRTRRKRLLEDFYKDEETRLENLIMEFSKEFKLSKEEIEEIMVSFGGTIEELYIHLRKKYPPYTTVLPEYFKIKK